MVPFSSVFSQLLKLFPRLEFEQLVRKHGAERHARGFSCWQQFVAMLFCQLGKAQSLREICQGLCSVEGKLVHLGVSAAPSRSTLAYANRHRRWELFQAVFFSLLDRCREVAPGRHPLRFKNPLLSLDATTIELCASLFNWAKYKRTKGAVKLHLLLDHDGYLPTFAVITDGKTSDIEIARKTRFPAGAVLTIDRGYNDYQWFDELTAEGVFFVTRMKRNTSYQVLETRPLPQDRGVVADETIQLDAMPGKEPFLLRRVEVENPEGGDNLVFLTNHLEFGPTTIAAIYKQRWQIELLFKVLKQSLRVKTFVGTSANALKIQLWTALIALLLLRYLKLKSRYGWSLSNLVAMLRFNLFTHRDLWAWIDDPFPKNSSPPP
ncbi:MAG: IS4 family transposase, partial [Candidatus Binatia bacterium]